MHRNLPRDQLIYIHSHSHSNTPTQMPPLFCSDPNTSIPTATLPLSFLTFILIHSHLHSLSHRHLHIFVVTFDSLLFMLRSQQKYSRQWSFSFLTFILIHSFALILTQTFTHICLYLWHSLHVEVPTEVFPPTISHYFGAKCIIEKFSHMRTCPLYLGIFFMLWIGINVWRFDTLLLFFM